MSSVVILKIKNNKDNRIFELLIKKNFNIDSKDFKFEEDNIITLKLNYRIGVKKVQEKLALLEGDFEVVKVSWPKLSDKESEELESLIKKRKFN